MIWADVTSYSQGERGKKPQTAFQSIVSGTLVWVSCGHRYYPNEWVFNCRELGILEKRIAPVDGMTPPEACAAAIEACWHQAKAMALRSEVLADKFYAEMGEA